MPEIWQGMDLACHGFSVSWIQHALDLAQRGFAMDGMDASKDAMNFAWMTWIWYGMDFPIFGMPWHAMDWPVMDLVCHGFSMAWF